MTDTVRELAREGAQKRELTPREKEEEVWARLKEVLVKKHEEFKGFREEAAKEAERFKRELTFEQVLKKAGEENLSKAGWERYVEKNLEGRVIKTKSGREYVVNSGAIIDDKPVFFATIVDEHGVPKKAAPIFFGLDKVEGFSEKHAAVAGFEEIQRRVVGRDIEVSPNVSRLIEHGEDAILSENIRRVVNPDGRDLTVFYGGAGGDIKAPLASTDARRFVFADLTDFSTVGDYMLKDLEKAGASGIEVTEEAENLHVIKFNYGGRERELIYHSKTDIFAEDFDLRKLRGLEDGFDIYYETCVSSSIVSGGFKTDGLHAQVASNMRAGGFMLIDYSPLEVFGDIYSLRRVDFSKDNLSEAKFGYSGDGVKLFYKGESAEPIPRELVLLESKLRTTYLSRNGGLAGVKMDYIPEYVEDLERLKEIYDRLPDSVKGEVKSRLDGFLYYAPPDRKLLYTGPSIPEATDEEFKAFVEACNREYTRIFGAPEPIEVRIEEPAIVVTKEDLEKAREEAAKKVRIVITKEDIERARAEHGVDITITDVDLDVKPEAPKSGIEELAKVAVAEKAAPVEVRETPAAEVTYPSVPLLTSGYPTNGAETLRRAQENARKVRDALDSIVFASEDVANEPAREFNVDAPGRGSLRVVFPRRHLERLRLMKQISMNQPGLDDYHVAEIPAYIFGVERDGEVVVTRTEVADFTFEGDTISVLRPKVADLRTGEKIVGTYHTHPYDAERWGVLSEYDIIGVCREINIELSGGRIINPRQNPDKFNHLFDIVDPRNGDWSVYVHNERIYDQLNEIYESSRARRRGIRPVNEMRRPTSPYYLRIDFKDLARDERAKRVEPHAEPAVKAEPPPKQRPVIIPALIPIPLSREADEKRENIEGADEEGGEGEWQKQYIGQPQEHIGHHEHRGSPSLVSQMRDEAHHHEEHEEEEDAGSSEGEGEGEGDSGDSGDGDGGGDGGDGGDGE